MDEGLLNDLLECSVCLERLDTSSRVLPCQHTFCLKCLKVIVESRKELRCPECRVLVEAKIEELPPNVLLMRILEGMNTRKGGQRVIRGHAQVPGQIQHTSKTLPPHGRAIYDFISKEPGDLSFKRGETILIQKKLDAFWFQGECSGRNGMFPITYVQVVIPLPVNAALCKALYDFRMSGPDEEGCLAFDKGAIITVHRRVDENWAEGRLDQRLGIFPLAFVELNITAQHLINSGPLNRPVPPVPEMARAGHSELARHHAQLAHRYHQMSISTPAATQSNYQNVATMSQSHPNYHQMAPQTPVLVPQNVNQSVGLVTAVPRNIIEPTQSKHSLDLIHFANVQSKGTMSLACQNVPRNIENVKVRKKFEYTPQIHPQAKVENTYQNVRNDRFPASVASFNNLSSDSSSSANTPMGVSSTTTPNSSDTSTSESADPTPVSPENSERNTTVVPTQNPEEPTEENLEPSAAEPSPNTSMGVLSLNESSTATNTSLNVSLPAESPKPNVSGGSQVEDSSDRCQPVDQRLDVPCSSKTARSNGQDLLNFALGLQAALSPSHKDGYMARTHRDHHREKRHSLTPSTHLQGSHTPNRHSAEILATSLLDHMPERDRDKERPERERERRRRRSRSNELALPAAYVAIYPYKPQKNDELELKKGAIYTVTERCRDGWFKGYSERLQRSGVFPGNYVAPATGVRPRPDKSAPAASPSPAPSAKPASQSQPQSLTADPPDAPPRAHSPLSGQPMSYPWCTSQAQPLPVMGTPRFDKSSKQKLEKPASSISSGVSLMKRLAAMKKCKSPPPAYSMDNPVFEDSAGPSPGPSPAPQPQHVRTPAESSPWQTQHRKSQSLDVTATATRKEKDRHHTQPMKERFRCIVAYPPNSEYELELKVDDIVLVTKKRGDGWYKGTLQRTGRTGLFPASFVQSCPE